jgi:hypothetical protein
MDAGARDHFQASKKGRSLFLKINTITPITCNPPLHPIMHTTTNLGTVAGEQANNNVINNKLNHQ